MAEEKYFDLKIISPNRIFYQGKASMVELNTLEGRIGIYRRHLPVTTVLEPGIAEMAALNATPEDIKKLRDLCDQVEIRIKNGSSYIKEDIAFHTCVAECAKNKVVEQLIPIIDTAVLMFVNVTHTRLKEETIMTHRAVVDAIADHDSIGARSAMMMHMTFNRNMIRKLMKEKAQPPLS